MPDTYFEGYNGCVDTRIGDGVDYVCIAVEFTPTVDHLVTWVNMWLGKTGVPGDFRIKIYDSGWNVLWTSQIYDWNDVPNASGEEGDLWFPVPKLQVENGKKYFLALITTEWEVGGGDYYTWAAWDVDLGEMYGYSDASEAAMILNDEPLDPVVHPRFSVNGGLWAPVLVKHTAVRTR